MSYLITKSNAMSQSDLGGFQCVGSCLASMLAGPAAGRHFLHASHKETGDLGEGEQIPVVTIACSSYLRLHS